jgi:hypothetical protein
MVLQNILRVGVAPLIVFGVAFCGEGGEGGEDGENRPGIERGEERSGGERGEEDEEDD